MISYLFQDISEMLPLFKLAEEERWWRNRPAEVELNVEDKPT